MKSPLLICPRRGESLLLYLVVTLEARSFVLMREESSIQFPIKYVSNILKTVELRYFKIKKIGYTFCLMIGYILRALLYNAPGKESKQATQVWAHAQLGGSS